MRLLTKRRIEAFIDRVHDGDRGAALLLVALSLVLLMGMAAFGTDLAWFYLNASRVQRTADAAALGGVVWLPEDETTALSTAQAIATQNGYTHDPINLTTTVVPERVTGELNQLQVTVTDTVPTFFLRVFGRTEQVIARDAVAQFIPPLRLGSPENQFGNACDPGLAGCSDQPGFWANIHGKYTRRGMGDAFAAWCINNSGTNCGSAASNQNPLWRERGYLYGIEVDTPGSSFTVEFVDMQFRNISGVSSDTCSMGNRRSPMVPTGCTSDWMRTGDRGCEDGGWGGRNYSSDCGMVVITRLYAPDPDPFNLDNNVLLCQHTWQPEPQIAHADPYVWQTPSSCFTVSNASAGIYVLQITIEEPANRRNVGLNRYGVRVSSTAKIFGMGDMSIYNNLEAGESDFYLAEVNNIYRGRKFVIEMFDPGEGNGWINLMRPTGATWTNTGTTCDMYTRPVGVMTGPWNFQGTRTPCRFQADNSAAGQAAGLHYDDRWIKLEVPLPSTYDCDYAGGECWWKVNYDYTSAANDTTTWRAYILGNPIHLVK